ncbi:MAG: PqqD family protein [Oscillospiraceae bacterium]|nr:PqqD family protein [Oscillospiraceae bacterium]
MRVSTDFILREVAGEWLLVPVGDAAVKLRGLIGLSESGYLIYTLLQKGADRQELLRAVLSEYKVDQATAEADVDAFLGQMRSLGILLEA